MLFPTTGILDNFNRADENPLSDGGNWSGPIFPGDQRHQVLTNLAAGAGAFPESYRSNTTYGPDAECFFTIQTLPATGEYVSPWVRMQTPNTTGLDGYTVTWTKLAGVDSLQLFRIDNTVGTQLGATVSLEMGAGDRLGIEAIGSVISVYVNQGSGWVQQISATDATYGAAGNIGMDSSETTYRIDDFGGGTAAAVTPQRTLIGVGR